MLKAAILRELFLGADAGDHDIIINAFVGGSTRQGTSTTENDITTICSFVTIIAINTSIKQSTSSSHGG